MKVKEILSSNDPVFVTYKDTIECVAQLLEHDDLGTIPVVENHQTMKFMGVISEHDIIVSVVAAGHDPRKTIVEQFMTRDAATVALEDDAARPAQLLEERPALRLAVLGKGGALVGMIDRADLAPRAAAPPVANAA